MEKNVQSVEQKPNYAKGRPRLGRLTGLVEIAIVLSVGFSVVLTSVSVYGKDPIISIASVWAANTLMLALIYGGLRARGQSWSHFGLDATAKNCRSALRAFLQSLAVFVAAIGAFVLAAIVMANIVGMPEPADMSKYDYLRGNILMTLLALLSVYLVSSAAEEIIYRGFVITRLTECASGTRSGKYVAVLVSSLLFGLVHSDWGIAGMVQASSMGIAMGISYLVVKRNLWVTILAHGYMDTILILQMYAGGA